MAAHAGDQRPAWHALPVDETAQRLGVSLAGLTAAEAATRLQTYGPNALPEPRPRSLLGIFVGQLRSPLIYLLLAAAVAAVALGELADALFIGAVLILNSAIGGTQEWRAEINTAALRSSIRALTRVLRDDSVKLVESSELVPGDVVLLEVGRPRPRRYPPVQRLRPAEPTNRR